MSMHASPIKIAFGDYGLGAAVADHDYLFSYEAGGLTSLRVAGKEWLYRAPKPNFWRATTENDRGSGFEQKTNAWLGASLFATGALFSVAVDGTTIALPQGPENNRFTGAETAQTLAVCFRYTYPLTPQAYCDVTYTVQADGSLRVAVAYPGFAGVPALPVFGLTLVMPTPAVGFDYCGLSGETYPDRMAGGVPGTYHVDGLPVTPYLVPQDCGVHMATQAVTITRKTTQNNADHDATPFSLTATATAAPFAFSCLPYTAFELENATHQNELPPVRRTVLTVMGAVRGVGGIDSWGTDVQPPYRIAADQPHAFEFTLA